MMYYQREFKFELVLDNSTIFLPKIYDMAYSSYSEFAKEYSEKAMPVALDLEVESMNGEKALISAKAIIAVNETCFTPKHFVGVQQSPCYGDIAPFDPLEGYFAGAGDEELDLQNFYLNPMCDQGCGNIQPCQTGPTTAYEAVEAAINTNYLACNIPESPIPGKVFVGFTNIQCEYVDVSFQRAGCGVVELFSGTCMMGDVLNCIYCSIYSEIGGQIPIPAGKHFVSINLGHDACVCGASNTCEYLLEYSSWAKVCYGVPVFKKHKVFWEAPIDVALDDLETP